MRPDPKQPRHNRTSGIFPIPAFFAAVILFAAILSTPGVAAPTQSAPPPNPKAFVGTWTATYKGTQFMTLWFEMKAGKLTGMMSRGQIDLDAEGNISDVKVRPGKNPVTIQKVEHNALYMTRGANNLRLVVRLKDKTHAQLEFLDSPVEGITPKPIPLVKETKKQ